MIYVVSYDFSRRPVAENVPKREIPRLRKEARRRVEAFYDELENSPDWAHYLERTWLISTLESANELNARLRRHLRDDDLLLVIRVTPDYAGWLPEGAWTWLKERAGTGTVTW